MRYHIAASIDANNVKDPLRVVLGKTAQHPSLSSDLDIPVYTGVPEWSGRGNVIRSNYGITEGGSRIWVWRKGEYIRVESAQSREVGCRRRKGESSGCQVKQRSETRECPLHPPRKEREKS